MSERTVHSSRRIILAIIALRGGNIHHGMKTMQSMWSVKYMHQVTKSRGWLLFVILFLFLIFCGRLQAHSCMNLNLCYCVIGMPSSSPEDILWYHFVAHNSLACIQLLDSSPNAMGPGGGGNISNPNLASRQRLRWTSELHERFVDAVTQLGGPDS